VLAVGNDRQFAALCAVVGAPELAVDPRFTVNASRVAHRAELREALERALATRPAAVWAADLLTAGVPAGVVNDVETAFRLATELGLRPIVELPRPDGSTVALTRNPIGLSETPPVYRSAPPRLGLHRLDALS
jgi:crotonobetainyl-CoA:carnitine CoA-transferase CaiB-like acyl-CoA transferase